MNLKETYQPRRIAFHELYEASDWQLKIYTILHQAKTLDEPLINAAKQTALEFLPQPASTQDYYGVGFVSVHQGRSYDFVTVAYWCYDTELRHQTYMRPSSSSYELEALTASELSSDVWDLRVLAFERDAWLRTILNANTPDKQAYLNERLNELE